MSLWKKMWNPRWRPRNGCDGKLIAKIIITRIQVNLVQFVLAATLDFTSFFTLAFLGALYFFNSWTAFGLDFTSFCNCILQCWHISINGCCYLSFCFLYSGRYVQYFTCVSRILLFNFIYFVHVNDCRLIKSKLEAAK